MNNMKSGDKINCPHCHQETVLKEKVVMDGWTQTGKFLGCAICGGKIAEIEVEIENGQRESKKLSGLASLLGEDAEPVPVIITAGGVAQFCRDCLHFVRHPFFNRCEMHKKEVNPMDDCPDFAALPKPEKE